MFHRFHGNRRAKSTTSGKWQSVPRPGIAAVQTLQEGDWEIRVTRRQTGTTIRRQVYGISIRADMPKHEEFLNGFSSPQVAIAAARRRIAILDSVRRREAQRRLVRRR